MFLCEKPGMIYASWPCYQGRDAARFARGKDSRVHGQVHHDPEIVRWCSCGRSMWSMWLWISTIETFRYRHLEHSMQCLRNCEVCSSPQLNSCAHHSNGRSPSTRKPSCMQTNHYIWFVECVEEDICFRYLFYVLVFCCVYADCWCSAIVWAASHCTWC